MRNRIVLSAVCALICAIAACDNSGVEPGGGPQKDGSCIPGETQSCLCVGNQDGVQSCDEAGHGFLPCICAKGGGGAGGTCAHGTEVCNGVDDDCDGEVDEADADGCTSYMLDEDGDGFGVESDTACLCEPSWTYQATVGGDCDDSLPSVNPGVAADECNAGAPADDDCDGFVDDDAAAACANADAYGGPKPKEEPLWYPLASKSWSEGTYTNHPGNAVDIACPSNTPVYAAKDGFVDFTRSTCEDNTTPLQAGMKSPFKECGSGYGNNIVINHIDGSVTRYAHLKKDNLLIAVGDFVCAGEKIALSGSSGNVMSSSGGNGAHLHFEYKNPQSVKVYPPTAFKDRTTYRGGNSFFEECAAIDSLHSSGALSKSCSEIQAASECTLNRAALAKVLGASVGVDQTSIFGQCDAQCDDMDKSDWYYSWIVAMTLLDHSDGIAAYNASAQCQPAVVPARVHALKAMMEALDLPTGATDQGTPDLDGADPPSRPYVNGAVIAGILTSSEYVSADRPLSYGWLAKTLTKSLTASNVEPVSDGAMMAACPGGASQCLDATDCDDANACTTDSCVSGSCAHAPAANGVPCGAGKTCSNGQCADGGSQCNNGIKEAGEACDGSDIGGATCQSQGFDGGAISCKTNTCALDVSACCDNQCAQAGQTKCSSTTVRQTCQVGPTGCLSWGSDLACANGCNQGSQECNGDPCANVSCASPPNNQCYNAAGVCAAGICSYSQKPAGSACNDSNLCTSSDVCGANGACSGSPMQCNSPPNAQCYNGVGMCSGGSCSYTPKGGGSACSDGNSCTTGDACDGNGTCSGSPLQCNSPPNAQCYSNAGMCSGGSCSYTPKPSGTSCNDGNPNTNNDVCNGNGTCSGCSPSVNNVGPLTVTLNQSTSFTIAGNCMPATIAPFIPECANLMVTSTSATLATFQCTPSFSTGVKNGIVKDKPGGAQLYSFNVNVQPCVANVASVTPSTATLNQLKTFTITGSCLPDTIAPFIPECANLIVTSTSPTQATFQCTPSFSTGVKSGVVKDKPGGSLLKSFSVTVN